MNNLLLNFRVLFWHLQVRRDRPFVSLEHNPAQRQRGARWPYVQFHKLALLLLLAACAPTPTDVPDVVAEKPQPAAVVPTPLVANVIVGTVTGITDGDTLRIGEERIRLRSIDTPEHKSGKRWPEQPYAEESEQQLRHRAEGKVATCRVIERDRYNRAASICTVDGVDIGREQVRTGMAWNYVTYGNLYAAEEQEARTRQVGLWVDDTPTAPWSWRRGDR